MIETWENLDALWREAWRHFRMNGDDTPPSIIEGHGEKMKGSTYGAHGSMGAAPAAMRRGALRDTLATMTLAEQVAIKAMQGRLTDYRNMGNQLALEVLAALGQKAEEIP